MTALTANRSTQQRVGGVAEIEMGVDVIYAGGMVTVNASGYAVAAQDAAGHRFAGVATKQVDNSGGVAGDKIVPVERTNEYKLRFNGSAAQADVGKSVYVVDDQTVQLAQPGVGNVYCGEITAVADDGDVWVDIEPATKAKQGHVVILKGDITAATTTDGGDAISLANPFGERAVILDVILDVTTPATGAATADVGVGATAATSDDTLLDGVDIGTAAILANNIDNAGTNGGRGVAWPADEFLTASNSATLAGLVGEYYIVCFVPTARG